jgi:hypothetical protein
MSDKDKDLKEPLVDKKPDEKPEIVTLTKEEINSAKQTIDKSHPLSRTPLLKVLPYCRFCPCCVKKPKKDFRMALRKSLLNKLNMKMSKTDILLEQDPFLRLGFGMNAFFDTLTYLMRLMLLMFLFSLPMIYIYSSYGAIENAPKGFISRFSLGNMGGASVMCKIVPLTTSNFTIACPVNSQISTGSLSTNNFGVMPASLTKTNYCLRDAAASDKTAFDCSSNL